MCDTNEDPDPPNDLSDDLIARLDALDIPELKAVLSYVRKRIDSLRTPLEEEIEATAAGDVVEIETHGAYALVRMHPPDSDEPDSTTDLVSLYHVRREPQLDGTESLHWAYLGDVGSAERVRCTTCGRPLEKDVTVCPHCGTDTADHSSTEE